MDCPTGPTDAMVEKNNSIDDNLPRPAPVKIRPANAIQAYVAETEYVVSPSTPLLSTEVQENGWVCGSNSKGQLGIPGSLKITEPQPIQTVGCWATIAIGREGHAAGVSCDGQLYTWGSNHKGQLGLGNADTILVEQPKLVTDFSSSSFKESSDSKTPEVKLVACGLEHTICVTTQHVYVWGSNSHGQLGLGSSVVDPAPEVPMAPRPTINRTLSNGMMVTQVACGNYHSLCVTAQSQVYAWGSNSHGQLGQGDKRSRHVPTVIDSLWALPVIQLAAGDFHSCALTTGGQLFTWGSNISGQLGLPPDAELAASLGSTREGKKKSKRKTNQKYLMIMIEMGIPKNRAELALEETGNMGVEQATEWLFSHQENSVDQLLADDPPQSSPDASPHKEDSSVLVPRRVPIRSVRYVAAGASHTVAVSSGYVYSWGEGRLGALGHPDLEDRGSPTRITALDHKNIEKVVCGSHHNLFLSRDGDVYGCGWNNFGQLPTFSTRMKDDSIVAVPTKLNLPFNSTKTGANGRTTKVPVVHEVAAGGPSSAFLTRGPDEIPDTFRVDLLDRLQSAVAKAAKSAKEKDGKTCSEKKLKAVAAGVEMVFGSAAAISAAFGHRDQVGLNVELLDKVQTTVLQLFTEEQSLVKAMSTAASKLLEDLRSHARLLGTPERAQVLLAAAQHPLLADPQYAKLLLPTLCATILSAPSATRHLLVRWWSEYPASLLEERVVKPIQSYLTRELMAARKLTISVMNAIKVLARVEEANQLNRRLGPEVFYNQLISEKMDVQDHYTAWRQTQDAPVRKQGFDGPFSFCSYPFLLDARAKSNLLYIEARFQMEQTVAHARMEQQLYGSTSRTREDDQRVIAKKVPLKKDDAEKMGKGKKNSSDSRRRSSQQDRGLGRLVFNLLRGRHGETSEGDSPKSVESALRRDGSMNLPKPTDCSMPGVHSDMCIVRVRRHHLVEDALDEIARQYKKDLFKPLRVHFIGEDGIDAGGVKKEFFQLLVTELLSPEYGMLVYQSESHTYWFNSHSLEGDEQFMLLGLVLGLAIYNRVLLDFPLPLALYKKLLSQTPTLRDLEDMQPTLGRSLRQLLAYDGPGTVEDVFYQTFSVETNYFGEMKTIALKAGGENIFVNEDNRSEYVELLVDYILVKSVHRQFEAFRQGFRILCEGPAISLFNAQELERLVCGNPILDFDALEKNSKYEGGFSAQTTAVIWLWEIVKELEMDEKKMFLKFFTGSDRAPIGGLGALKCIIQRDGPDSNKLPTSHTCFNTLLLPEYATKNKMRDLLKLAIMNSEGFGLE